jgi:murein L,D-transpeptidase YafK
VSKLRIEIKKREKKLRLFEGESLLRTFDLALGFAAVGTKEIEGDGKTPEGEYIVCVKNPKSSFHLSLGINYPNSSDARRGFNEGLITREEFEAIVEAVDAGKLPSQKTALGGEIYIHGGGIDGDWTRGCVGLDDSEMTELYEVVEVGTTVLILP